MRVENVDAAFHAGVPCGAGEEWLVEKSAAGMESESGHLNATGNLQEFWICGNRDERKIGAANFRCAVGFESEHGSVGGRAEIPGGVIGGEGRKLIGRGGIPERERATGRGGKRDKDLICHCHWIGREARQ